MAVIVVDQSPGQQEVVVNRPIINFPHFTTPHGILLLVQFIIAIIIFVVGGPIFLNIVSWIAWICTHLLIWVYLFSLNERYKSTPPLKVVEFYFNGGAALLYLLCTILSFFTFAIISAVFALLNTIAYGASVFFLFPDWRDHRQATQATPK